MKTNKGNCGPGEGVNEKCFGPEFNEGREPDDEAANPYDRTENFDPQVGNGVTYTIGSDSYAATVVAREPRKVTVQLDSSRQIGDYYGAQRFMSTPNPNGTVMVFTLRGDGRWRSRGSKYGYLSAGRHPHIDPGF